MYAYYLFAFTRGGVETRQVVVSSEGNIIPLLSRDSHRKRFHDLTLGRYTLHNHVPRYDDV